MSEDIDFNKFNTDKIQNRYLEIYNSKLKQWHGKRIKLLELGILKGGSLLMWDEYFPGSTIAGVDLRLPDDFPAKPNIHMYKGNQLDKELLSKVADEIAPEGFDIIIDDASHEGLKTRVSFWHLFDNHLKPGGLFIIEDWATGYWEDWSDGKSLDFNYFNHKRAKIETVGYNWFQRLLVKIIEWFPVNKKARGPLPVHSYGMSGFVKQLVDEQAARLVTRVVQTGKGKRDSKFDHIEFYTKMVFVYKAVE